MTVEQVLEEVKALTPEERQRVRAALDSAIAEQNPASPLGEEETLRRENLLEQRLRAAGLLEEMPLDEDGDPGAIEPEEFQPVTVVGEPVSETIMRERR